MSAIHQIFVDDTDPNIIYDSDAWISKTFDVADSAEFLIVPLYETLHLLSAGGGSIIYTFNGRIFHALIKEILPEIFTDAPAFKPGTDISAFFTDITTNASITACMVDGQIQGAVLLGSEQPSLLTCETDHSLSEGPHQLVINVSNNGPILFDYITYTPSEGNTPVGDVLYYAGDPSVKISPQGPSIGPGGSLDFDFFGYSLGLYGFFVNEESHFPSNASYAIDDQAPINFTINNVATLANYIVGPALVLQTPGYPLGQHHFHMDFLGTNVTVPFNFEQIIVQNSTSHVNLESFPPTSSTGSQSPVSPSPSSQQASTSPSPGSQNHNDNHLGLAVGVTAGAIVTLVLIISIIFSRRQKRSLAADGGSGSALAVHPFILPRILQIGRAKERGGEEQLQGRGRLKPGHRSNNIPGSRPAPRVIIHVDSEDRPNEPDVQAEVVELPPAYRSVRQSQTSLNSPLAQPPPLPTNEVIHIREKPVT